MSELKYTIFAGVNGAGKTSLYSILKQAEDFGERINIDEIVAKHGSWKDAILQLMAGRRAMTMINDFIFRRVTFHQETTLTGNTMIKQIKKARSAGYQILLYYVGVENPEIAIKRVKTRVDKGGHGVEEQLILQRFEKLPETLHNVIPLCDAAFFYDNTSKFKQIAYLKNNIVVDFDFDLPVWFWEIIARNDVKFKR